MLKTKFSVFRKRLGKWDCSFEKKSQFVSNDIRDFVTRPFLPILKAIKNIWVFYAKSGKVIFLEDPASCIIF